MAVSDGVTFVGYVDDTAAIIVAPDLNTSRIKTEIMVLSGRRIETIVTIRIGDQIIETKPSAMYLGDTIDTKLAFAEHIRKATEKASIQVGQLRKIMANMRGPRPQVRRLLMSTVHSILLYGAEVWADVMRIQKYRHGMNAVQRKEHLESLVRIKPSRDLHSWSSRT